MMKKNNDKINNIFKKKKYQCLIVAEISANHEGKLSNVLKIIDSAKKIGVDAIKIQLYKADKITLNSFKKDFLIKSNNAWKKYKSLFNLYKKAQTPYSWYDKINSYCKKKNIILFSSVFDLDTINFLEKKNCPIYKIASQEITDIPLIKKTANTKKPVFLSSGLSSYKDLSLAIKTLKKKKCKKIVLMKCTSAYPAPHDEINLMTMLDFKKKFNVEIGFSDHTIGIETSIAAVALGAKVVEKHITLKQKKNSVDGFFSSDLKEFEKLVKSIRNIEKNLGKITYNVSKSSKKNLGWKKSLYVIKNINKNEIFTSDNFSSIRPAYGLHPKYYPIILGKKAKKNLKIGDRIKKSFY